MSQIFCFVVSLQNIRVSENNIRQSNMFCYFVMRLLKNEAVLEKSETQFCRPTVGTVSVLFQCYVKADYITMWFILREMRCNK